MILFKLKIILPLFVATLLVFCSNLNSHSKKIIEDSLIKQEHQPDKNDTGYTRVEVYCWCFLNAIVQTGADGKRIEAGRACNTTIRVTPGSLIDFRYLLDSTANQAIIARFKRVFFNSGNYEPLDSKP